MRQNKLLFLKFPLLGILSQLQDSNYVLYGYRYRWGKENKEQKNGTQVTTHAEVAVTWTVSSSALPSPAWQALSAKVGLGSPRTAGFPGVTEKPTSERQKQSPHPPPSVLPAPWTPITVTLLSIP